MSESIKNILIVGNGKEFIVRNCVNQLISKGNTVYLSDTSEPMISPISPTITTIIIFSDGNTASKHMIHIPEVCTINKEINVCLIGDKMGIQEALGIVPKNNIKKILYRPIGLNEILETVATLDEQSSIVKRNNGIVLLCSERLYNEGFTRKFIDYKVYAVEDFSNLQLLLELKDILLFIAESTILEDNDYANYNILCALDSFQKLPLVVLVDNSDVVTLAKANIMKPMDVIAKDMPADKIEDIITNAVHNPIVTVHQSIVIQGTQTTKAPKGSILNNLSNFGVDNMWN